MRVNSKLVTNIHKSTAIFILMCILIQLSTYPISFGVVNRQFQEQEWHVEVGDSRTFVVTKMYDTSQPDPQKSISLEGNEDNEFVYITTEVDTKIIYTITELLDISIAMGKRTINDSITLKEEPIAGINGIIRKTVQNKTYWESFYENESTTEIINGIEMKISTQVTNTLIIRNLSYQLIFNEPVEIIEIIHWEWMNGWLNYRYLRFWNGTDTIYEYEIMTFDNSQLEIPWNILFGVIILLGITGLIAVNFHRRKR